VNGFEKQSAKMGAASWLSTERDSRSKTLKWSEYWPSVRMAMFWKTNQIGETGCRLEEIYTEGDEV
jgi:hypothetical protein